MFYYVQAAGYVASKSFLHHYQEKQAYNETVEKCYRPLVKVCDDEQGEVGILKIQRKQR